MPLDETVGVQIHGLGQLNLAAIVPDLNGPTGGCGRIVTQGNPLADEGGIDFEEGAVEADGAVFLDLAGGLEQEQLIEIETGLGEAYLRGGLCPALQWGLSVEAAVR